MNDVVAAEEGWGSQAMMAWADRAPLPAYINQSSIQINRIFKLTNDDDNDKEDNDDPRQRGPKINL